MAAHGFRRGQQEFAILDAGMPPAIVLRITLTAIAAFLLRLSGLQIAGGILLI